ncbi:MAG: hypothetical protein EOO11_17430 [Chitinophagaceae bacterium]|nr:MAG: hypothetical protein EOO11_17430 [Chitinophagaceae bacterium]
MNPGYLSPLLMGLLALAATGIAFYGLTRAARRTGWPAAARRRFLVLAALVVVAWGAAIGVGAYRGAFRITGLPPRPVVLMLAGVLGLTLCSFTANGRALLRALPLQALLYFQAFRIAVELVLFQGYREGALPVQMTFEGHNFDIIAGVLAVAAGYWVQHRKAGYRTVAVAYDIIGLGLLVNVLLVALRSMPTPLRTYTSGPDLGIVGTFPYIYLPSVLVVLAVAGHILSLRQLALTRASSIVNREGASAGAVAS